MSEQSAVATAVIPDEWNKYSDHLVKVSLNPVIAKGIPKCYKDADEWAFDFFCGDFPYNHYEEVCNALLQRHQLTLEAFKVATGMDLAAEIEKARDYVFRI